MLGHLEVIFDRTRAAARTRTVNVGTFSSLAPWLFPALEQLMADAIVNQVADHGDRLVEWVGEGSLDAAFVAVANQMRLPATVSAVPLAGDRLAVLTPPAVSLGAGRRPFGGLDVISYTYDMSAEALHNRLSELGGRPRTAATAETAVRMARSLGCPAVLPRGLALAYAEDGEHVSPVSVPGRLTLFMVTRRPTSPEFAAVVTRLPGLLGLQRPPTA